MKLLHGITAPPGNGRVVEVHLDIMEAPASFLCKLCELGFQDDPFLEFYPLVYRFHYTGRTRAVQKDLRATLAQIEALVTGVLDAARGAGVRMYAETELVRSVEHLSADVARSLSALEAFSFQTNETGKSAKADVHIEFASGTVPVLVRSVLLKSNFYWVRTPASELFPSEEIATLQTSTFAEACLLYDRLIAHPLPACTGIHLEQKLGMLPSHTDLSMPPVTNVGALSGRERP